MDSTADTSVKRGRPEGSAITAEYRLRKELVLWVATATKTRELADKLLAVFDGKLKSDALLKIDDYVGMLSGVNQMVTACTRFLDSSVKFLKSAEGGGQGAEGNPDDSEAALRELTGGRG